MTERITKTQLHPKHFLLKRYFSCHKHYLSNKLKNFLIDKTKLLGTNSKLENKFNMFKVHMNRFKKVSLKAF